MQDLFTAGDVRGRGVGRALIAAVTAVVQARGGHRLYWQTHTTNAAGRALYDRVSEHKGFIVYGQDF
ncbi:GNAT family N-acetyltransferase [Mitsuaria sp. CC2]